MAAEASKETVLPTAELINQVTWKIPNALALVGSRSGEKWNGMTTSWITQVAMEPVLIAISVDNTAVTHELISSGGSFTVNLWSPDNTRPFVKFSKPATFDNMTLNGLEVFEGVTGAPIFADALAWMECEVRDTVRFGSHSLFIGELVDCNIIDADAPRAAAISDTRMKYGGVPRGGHN